MTETPAVTTPRRKLIEVALPLEAINRESAREKSIRHGHPSTLHLWWARRPLAACRAVLFAQLVDDPSARPEEFPTEEDQTRERARLFNLIERLVVWENIDRRGTPRRSARRDPQEHGRQPATDPRPLRRRRVHPARGPATRPRGPCLRPQPRRCAHQQGPHRDPAQVGRTTPSLPRRRRQPPRRLAPRHRSRRGRPPLRAVDARRSREAHRPPLPQGHPAQTAPQAPVIAWIWARTVTCPNPACGIEMPLARSFWLSKKKTRPAWIDPSWRQGRVASRSTAGPGGPRPDGTVGRKGAICVACQTPVDLKYVREFGRTMGLGQQLVAVVAEGNRQRVYVHPTPEQEQVAAASDLRADDPGDGTPASERWFPCPGYGMDQHWKLFTNRQLVALTTFSDLVGEARDRAEKDAITAGLPATDAAAYADAWRSTWRFAVQRTG